MKESKIEKELKDIIKSFNLRCYSVAGKTKNDNGVADIVCGHGDITIWFETKVESNTYSIEQMLFFKTFKHSYMIKKIKSKWVCYNYFDKTTEYELGDLLRSYIAGVKNEK
jgi:hypothetical protein